MRPPIDALTSAALDFEWPDVKWQADAGEPDPPQLLDQFGRPISPRKKSRNKRRASLWKRHVNTLAYPRKQVPIPRFACYGVSPTTLSIGPRYSAAGMLASEAIGVFLEEGTAVDIPAPAVEVTVKVTARVICSRCGAPLPAGEHTFNVTSPAGKIEIPALGLCPCMRTWDGTSGDLLPRRLPASEAVSLQSHQGDCSGDGVPRGALKAIGSNSGEG